MPVADGSDAAFSSLSIFARTRATLRVRRTLSSCASEKEGLEVMGVGRFCQVGIKPRSLRPASVLLLPPARECNKEDVSSPRLSPERTRHAVAIEIRHSDIQQPDLRTECLCQ
jgi:hypothetical protein